jgi:hypothetical protein
MALDSITQMPNLPITSAFKASLPAAPKGRIGPKEIAPAAEELSSAISTASQKVGEADVNIEKAKREEKANELEIKAESKKKLVEDIELMPERLAYKEIVKQEKGMEFIPTRDTVQDIAGLFGLIGVVGMVIGKGNAMQAMGAMNGMMEGHRKGRQDLFKQESQQFEKNFKAMQAKVSAALAEYQEALKVKQQDSEAGELMAQVALARSESPFLKAVKDRQGDDAVLQRLKEVYKSVTVDMPRTINDLQDKADEAKAKAIEKERDRQFRLEMAQIAAQGTQNRRDEKALQALGPALREIASQYPDGTANNLVGASPKDKDRITGSWRAIQESEDVADYVARNPNAVGAMAVVKNILKIDAIKSIKNEDEKQAAVDKSAMVDAAIDKAVQQNKITSDDAQSAKILQKKLFSLALSDVQGSGQRGSVYLDRQFQNLYDQASRQSTLMEIVRERAMENDRNLKMYKLNVERNQYPQNFPLINTQSVDTYIQERKPKSSVPSDIEKSLQGKPDGTGKKAPDGKIYRIYGGVVKESAE